MYVKFRAASKYPFLARRHFHVFVCHLFELSYQKAWFSKGIRKHTKTTSNLWKEVYETVVTFMFTLCI